jgi:hypothetical protein
MENFSEGQIRHGKFLRRIMEASRRTHRLPDIILEYYEGRL